MILQRIISAYKTIAALVESLLIVLRLFDSERGEAVFRQTAAVRRCRVELFAAVVFLPQPEKSAVAKR
jgi:hypothetical protein